jgi:hypothetical protein
MQGGNVRANARSNVHLGGRHRGVHSSVGLLARWNDQAAQLLVRLRHLASVGLFEPNQTITLRSLSPTIVSMRHFETLGAGWPS